MERCQILVVLCRLVLDLVIYMYCANPHLEKYKLQADTRQDLMERVARYLEKVQKQ